MDYKKIIKSQETRFKFLHFFKFISDSQMVKLQYKIKTKRKLDLKNPIRYSEKIQWYKLNFRDAKMSKCVDKYGVREYVESKGLKHILNKLYAVYDNTDQIDMDNLPSKFVIKTTNGSATNILCKDKSKITLKELKKNFDRWLKRDIYAAAREWAYKAVKPRIIVEQYLEDEIDSEKSINDYKFLCFNGEIKYIFLDVDREKEHKRNIYDVDWNYLDISIDHDSIGDCVEKPEGLNEMIKVANILAADFPSVRVDLYWVNDKVYFGEMTFYPFSGYINFTPDEFDFILGDSFVLPNKLLILK